ncbi:hypothetical protein LGH70_16975 [Hymenobacter sp. BT635]|uniref:Lipoprotein n=1 Tax=Hymenobacter nitidus TaxID=2880929 RepID=A0ABS8AFS5_9BACT|nr:hypothetical protein [Hymenobacter nitidus]MCB2379293.1 hypothetical protein [Hymenobacter nitidus]
MRHFSSVLPAFTLLTLLALSACNVEGCIDEEAPAPAPACYQGTIVGNACMDGILIEVNSPDAIGKPLSPYANLVAAVNTQQNNDELILAGQKVKMGQVIYFNYTPSDKAREAFCPQNTVPLPIPHLVLSNVGTTGCAAYKMQ